MAAGRDEGRPAREERDTRGDRPSRRERPAPDSTPPNWTWDAAFRRYTRLVFSIPLRFGLSFHDSEDVFSNTWLTTHERKIWNGDWSDPPRPSRLTRWLVSVASWTTRQALARRRPDSVPPEELRHVEGPEGPLPGAYLAEMERRQTVNEIMDELSPRDREILAGLFLSEEPMSYAEVSKALGVAPGTVGPMRRRALLRLLRLFRERGFQRPDEI